VQIPYYCVQILYYYVQILDYCVQILYYCVQILYYCVQILAMDRPCALREKEVERVFSTPTIQQINSDYAEFFNLVGNNTGVDLSKNGFRDIWTVADFLYIQVSYVISCGR